METIFLFYGTKLPDPYRETMALRGERRG